MKITTLTIGLLALTLFAAGCGVNKQQNINADIAENSQLQGEKENTGWTGTIADAILTGKGMRCSWSASNDVNSTGYLKDGKVYSETEVAGKKTYMVMKDNCTWLWEGTASEGMKICADEDLVEDAEDSFDDFQDFDGASYQADTYVDCDAVNIPDSQFDIPSDVSFIDPYEAFLHDLQSSGVYE